jgi:hypothetical protein
MLFLSFRVLSSLYAKSKFFVSFYLSAAAVAKLPVHSFVAVRSLAAPAIPLIK